MFKVGDRVVVKGMFPIWSVNYIDYTKNKIGIVSYWGDKLHSQQLDLDWANLNLRAASKTEISQRDIRAIILNKERDKAEAENIKIYNKRIRNPEPIKKQENWDSWKRNMFNDMTHELPEPTRKKKEEKPKEVKSLKRSIEF